MENYLLRKAFVLSDCLLCISFNEIVFNMIRENSEQWLRTIFKLHMKISLSSLTFWNKFFMHNIFYYLTFYFDFKRISKGIKVLQIIYVSVC